MRIPPAADTTNRGAVAPGTSHAARPGGGGPRRVRSTELLRDADRLEIEHRGETYLLTLTRLGKLILTK